MSNSKMLIDASHPEETRVVVLKGNRVEEFDFESANKKQLRGNIYLAKVTRVEPSLQAAFVEYGGNRHGFLAFSEIHPDYYQIPHADRQALLEEEARAHRDEDEEGRNGERQARGDRPGRGERGGERGDRTHRRSRRHRRDGGVSALDRRGRPDETVSEPATDVEPLAEAIGFDGDGRVSAAVDTVASRDDERGDADDRETPRRSGQVDVVDEPLSDAEAPTAAEAEPPTATGPDATAADVPEAMTEAMTEAAPPVLSADEPTAPSRDPDAIAFPEAPEAQPRIVEVAQHGAGDDPADDGEDAPAAAEPEGGEPVEARDVPSEHEESDPDAENHPETERKPEIVEQLGGDALEDVSPRPARPRRHYKIQEVIKRRQILLIQVVKEERGNKGAALTTYLSLAGRYSVLMPNTARGGGISRKITDGDDRKRLKAIAQELDVPEGMGVILRTAGAARSNQEVRRDFEYLLRMWESVRELTLKSTAPTLVYEEGSLIKRSIRDLYSTEVDSILVAGEDGFGEARDFMRMLMPNNAGSVQLYRDAQPIFAKSGVEAQLDAMFSNHVTLKSGGYLVINQTEALVAIDVNSGRSTREHNIEDTALRTNLEAADEVARQLRLRDLAGLIVVDFIDMEESRNNRAVERRIKDALKNDRARIQIGHISHFGLMEMSRQRIRTGVLEGSTVVCPHCAGTGTVRSTASIALHVLRLVEDALIRDASHDIVVRSRTEVALYVLNQKRSKLIELEQRFGVSITVVADATLTGMVYHAIERGELAVPVAAPAPRRELVRVDSVAPIFEPDGEDEAGEDGDDEAEGEVETPVSGDQGDGGRRRKRRRRRRGRDRESSGDVSAEGPQPSDDGMAMMAEIGGDMPAAVSAPSEEPGEGAAAEASASDAEPADRRTAVEATAAGETENDEERAAEPPTRRRRSRRVAAVEKDEAEPATREDASPARRRRRPARSRAADPASEDTASADEAPARPSADRDVGADTVEHHPAAMEAAELAAPEGLPPAPTDIPSAANDASAPTGDFDAAEPAPEPDPDRPKRSGWWQRAKASFGG